MGKISVLVLGFLLVFFAAKMADFASRTEKPEVSLGSHVISDFDDRLFLNSVKEHTGNSFKFKISGAVLPHDLFAGALIANFFRQLALQKPLSIILLGPNHYEKGNFKVLTSRYEWETAFGRIGPDLSVINFLLDNDLAKVDEETVSGDHSITNLIPFIKYYLPDVKFVPLLLSGNLSEKDSLSLANQLSKMVSASDKVILASVDFSHYLDSEKAKIHDNQTLDAIKNFSYRQIYQFTNDNLDSPPSLGTMLMVMENLKKTNMDVLVHTNSGELLNNPNIATTSYFSIIYH